MLLQRPKGEPITSPEHLACSRAHCEHRHALTSSIGLGHVNRALKRFNRTAESIHLIPSICFFDLELSMGVSR